MMRASSNKYVIAPKRKMRDQIPSDWIEQLQSIDDLSFIEEPSSSRVLVEASLKAIELARSLLEDYCYIEPLIEHKKLFVN